MAETILSPRQSKILSAISRDKFLCKSFYLTGGTALAEYYLHHRLSEDLDFFSEQEFDPSAISVWFKQHNKELGIKKVELEQSFNRNLFFLYLDNKEMIKTEFTYFPFPRIAKLKKLNNLAIDSLQDIAVNKIFTIYQNPRSRDFIDLYLIISQEKYTLNNLIKQAKIKFDWHIDPLQLAAKLMLVTEKKDYPTMITKLNPEKWQSYWLKQAKALGQKIIQ